MSSKSVSSNLYINYIFSYTVLIVIYFHITKKFFLCYYKAICNIYFNYLLNNPLIIFYVIDVLTSDA